MSDHQHHSAAAVALDGSAPAKWASDLAEAAQWAVIALAALMLVAYQFEGDHQETIGEVVRVFLSIVLEALPFMLIGALVGGAIEVFVSRQRLSSMLAGRPARAVLVAGTLGLIFPVCECAVVPVVRRLLRKGVPAAAAVAYLLAGPIVNPIVAASTIVAYRSAGGGGVEWRIVLARLAIGYVVAVGIGLLMGALFRGTSALTDDPHDGEHEHGPGCGCGHEHAHAVALPARLAAMLRHAANDFLEIGRFLVLGSLIAGVLRGLVSQEAFLAIAARPAVAIPAMMAFAFVLTLCSEADAFVAASFRGLVPAEAQVAFLTLGPILDVKLLLMYTRLFRGRAMGVLITAIILAVGGGAMAFNLILG